MAASGSEERTKMSFRHLQLVDAAQKRLRDGQSLAQVVKWLRHEYRRIDARKNESLREIWKAKGVPYGRVNPV